MNFSQKYLEFTSVATLLIGLLVLFSPQLILNWFTPGSADAGFFVRFIGSALVGYAALNHFAAREKKAEHRRLAILSNIVTLTIATVLSIAGVMTGAIYSYEWLIVLEHVLFLTGFIAAYRLNS